MLEGVDLIGHQIIGFGILDSKGDNRHAEAKIDSKRVDIDQVGAKYGMQAALAPKERCVAGVSGKGSVLCCAYSNGNSCREFEVEAPEAVAAKRSLFLGCAKFSEAKKEENWNANGCSRATDFLWSDQSGLRF